LGGRQGFDPVDTRGLLAVILLGHLPYGSSPCRPRFHQEVLALAPCSDLPTTRGSVDALLKLEHCPLESLPGNSVPSLQRCRGLRGHGVLASMGSSTFHGVVSPSAYPVAFPWAFAFETIPFPTSMRLTPAPWWRANGA
jgi:hypothetical protein